MAVLRWWVNEGEGFPLSHGQNRREQGSLCGRQTCTTPLKWLFRDMAPNVMGLPGISDHRADAEKGIFRHRIHVMGFVISSP